MMNLLRWAILEWSEVRHVTACTRLRSLVARTALRARSTMVQFSNVSLVAYSKKPYRRSLGRRPYFADLSFRCVNREKNRLKKYSNTDFGSEWRGSIENWVSRNIDATREMSPPMGRKGVTEGDIRKGHYSLIQLKNVKRFRRLLLCSSLRLSTFLQIQSFQNENIYTSRSFTLFSQKNRTQWHYERIIRINEQERLHYSHGFLIKADFSYLDQTTA